MSQCAFCGHPDSRHRIIDASLERIEAGEPKEEVLADYGLDDYTFAQTQFAALGHLLFSEFVRALRIDSSSSGCHHGSTRTRVNGD